MKATTDSAAPSTASPILMTFAVVPARTEPNFFAPASSTLKPSETRKSLIVSAFIILSPFFYPDIVVLAHIKVVIKKRDATEIYRTTVKIFLVNMEGKRRTKNKIFTTRQAIEGYSAGGMGVSLVGSPCKKFPSESATTRATNCSMVSRSISSNIS